ncbi:hypothetical protein HPP92_002663 [Vanilla planifolia]|uniref:Uncharacterized protein n=1 Tax=Vanilla planifolia TaxID=51239 RepID=A0A835S6S1_VANPL|nr:hypothetical protein HPP92_002663 [Vanilla planifolia]
MWLETRRKIELLGFHKFVINDSINLICLARRLLFFLVHDGKVAADKKNSTERANPTEQASSGNSSKKGPKPASLLRPMRNRADSSVPIFILLRSVFKLFTLCRLKHICKKEGYKTNSIAMATLAEYTADRLERSKDQEILANILRNIASLCGSSNGNNSSHGLQASRDLLMVGASLDTPSKDAVAPTSGAPNVEGNANTLCSPARTISATPMANTCGIAFDVALSEFHHQKRFLGSTFSKNMQHSGRLVHEEDRLPSLS